MTAPITPITYDLYEKGAIEAAINSTPEWGILDQKSNMKQGDGLQLTFSARVGNTANQNIGAFSDLTSLQVRKTRHAQASLPWGRLANVEALSSWDLQLNNNDRSRMESYAKEVVGQQYRSITTQGENSLSDQFFNTNGETSTDELPIHGLATIFRPGTTLDTAKEAAIASGAEYAGLSLESGGLAGIDGLDARAWTPTMVNTDYDWDGAGATELTESNVPKVLGHLHRQLIFGQTEEFSPDCFLTSQDYFGIISDFIGEKQQIYISDTNKGGSNWGIGTSQQKLSHNGIPVYWSENIAASTGYLLNFNQIKQWYLDPKPVEGDYNQNVIAKGGSGKYEQKLKQFSAICERAGGRLGYVSEIVWGGQFQFNPRFQGQFKKYTA